MRKRRVSTPGVVRKCTVTWNAVSSGHGTTMKSFRSSRTGTVCPAVVKASSRRSAVVGPAPVAAGGSGSNRMYAWPMSR